MEIKFNNVSYIYNINSKYRNKVLDNINLKAQKEKITCIIGHGKTTIAKLMNIALLPSSGNIKIGRVIITKKNDNKLLNNLKKQIGFIPQNNMVFIYDTVKEELEHILLKKGYKGSPEQRIRDSLKIVHLSVKVLSRDPNSLSLSEQKKLQIALALSYNPKIIIFDEPSINLCGKSRKELIKIIRLMKLRYQKTIIVFSKDIDLVHELADYIYLIGDNKVIKEGEKYDVLSDKEVLNKYNLSFPKLIWFSNLVYDKKKIKMGYRDDINDLMKDVYRYVR